MPNRKQGKFSRARNRAEKRAEAEARNALCEQRRAEERLSVIAQAGQIG